MACRQIHVPSNVLHTYTTYDAQVYVGDSRLKSEHALDRDLLSVGITEGKRHTIVVDTNLLPDTPYR